MIPQRVQRRRTVGWRAPEGARYVGRGTRFGNPWVVTQTRDAWAVNWTGPRGERQQARPAFYGFTDRRTAHEKAVAYYRQWLHARPDMVARVRAELAGRDLMCWCPDGLPCHADVLLAVARGENP
ncbi:DUF4326 domain-containing protein [Streptomyces sp. NPDC092296]|uniref:DUF4326 domain-containing protein n=1 Tax=Streptomyces sp. NPDC092296 TaxID=3366012 RepID=UPI00381264D6